MLSAQLSLVFLLLKLQLYVSIVARLMSKILFLLGIGHGAWSMGHGAWGIGKGVWFDKLTNRGKGERLNLFLFPFAFKLFSCVKSLPIPSPF
jgi:hypothetical protein